MAFMDMFKGKKKAPPSPPPPYPGTPPGAPPPASPGLPIDQVQSLKDRGMPDDQIINTLQAQGYDPVSINNAIAQVGAGPPAGPMADIPGMPPPEPELPGFGRKSSAKEVPSENVEEIAESIVEEKWGELTKELAKFTEWKDKAESRVAKVEQELQDLKDDVENLHKAIVAKIGEYDKNLLDVGTEIKAMEKVFQKVLPELTGSVSELSRITKGIRGKKKSAE
ncbi:hypothetical protein KY338_02145 [Candidatus Woesearchaeota archaeon]|nr:hypothetical protein [Candidatus Woesearchaeota archaeon]MBW3006092.1 hypothetical protein [Candidatus Woesearchaeota archaeon]